MDNYEMQNNQEKTLALNNYVSAVMRRVYLKMTLALFVTTIVALYCSKSAPFLNFIFSNSWAIYALLFAELGVVIAISARLDKIKQSTASLLFYTYAILTGASFSVILLAYTEESIFITFLITTAVFGVMTLYGYVTRNDLTKMGTFLMMALIALIVVSVINMFVGSNGLQWLISFAGVAIFIGLTAWDTQKIKRMAEITDNENAGKLATIGALSLYLDFINLFLYLLRFFGSSRD